VTIAIYYSIANFDKYLRGSVASRWFLLVYVIFRIIYIKKNLQIKFKTFCIVLDAQKKETKVIYVSASSNLCWEINDDIVLIFVNGFDLILLFEIAITSYYIVVGHRSILFSIIMIYGF
jgi:hypothetical protein